MYMKGESSRIPQSIWSEKIDILCDKYMDGKRLMSEQLDEKF